MERKGKVDKTGNDDALAKKSTSVIASVSKLFGKKAKKSDSKQAEELSLSHKKQTELYKIEEDEEDSSGSIPTNNSNKQVQNTPSAILRLITQKGGAKTSQSQLKTENKQESDENSTPATVGWGTAIAAYLSWGSGKKSECNVNDESSSEIKIHKAQNSKEPIVTAPAAHATTLDDKVSSDEAPSYFRMAAWGSMFFSAAKKSEKDVSDVTPVSTKPRRSSVSFSDSNFLKKDRIRTKSKVLDNLGIETDVIPNLYIKKPMTPAKASPLKPSNKSDSFVTLNSKDSVMSEIPGDIEAGEYTGKGKKRKDSGVNIKMYIAITICSCICVGGLTFLVMTLLMGNGITSTVASTTSVNGTQIQTILPRASLRQFLSSLQVQEVDDEMADWSSDLKQLESPRAQKIIDALKPRIRSAFESEGFSTDDVIITKIGPISVTIYHVMNNTVTSLSSGDEISMTSTFEIKKGQTMPEEDRPKPQGHRLIIRVEFETAGKPSDNANLINQVGEAEVGKIQFMLGKYLENQGVVAKAESLEVSPEFQNIANAGRSVSPTSPATVKPEIEIDCYKTGRTLGMSRTVVGCPPKCDKVKGPTLIGTDWYGIDSMICLAAIHSYIIEAERGGAVEFLKSGESFLFAGSTRNNIRSQTLLEYGERFIVKKPGPSWTTIKPPTTTTIPATGGLQEKAQLLLTGQMTALSIDKSPISFSLSLSYSTTLASEMRSLLSNKLIYAMEGMEFDIHRIEVFGFEPDMTSSSALRLSFKAYGGYNANAQAMLPYKPWDSEMISNFLLKLKMHLNDEGLQLTGLTVQIDEDYYAELIVMQSTTTAIPTAPSSLCTCAEVFFIVSGTNLRSKSEVDSMVEIFKTLFDLADFDQFRLKVGMAVIVPSDSEEDQDSTNYVLITDVGNKEHHDIIADLTYELVSVVENIDSGGDSEHKDKMSTTIRDLENHKFFTDDFNTRSKLLVVTSSTIVGSDVDEDVEEFEKLKKKGIRILYTGYGWTEKDGYPNKYVSSPETDFVKSVRKIEDSGELADYIFDVMRKYICSESQGICAIRSMEPEDADGDLSSVKSEGSYVQGIPKGTGLELYEAKGGLSYKGKILAKTDPIRRTEPDLDQAYYMQYECGRQDVQPNVTERMDGRIVGGSEAMPHSWPWIVSINKLKSKYDTLTSKMQYTYNYWACGGTIVAPSWIVTAAHCFADGDEKKYTTKYKIVTGLHDQNLLSSLQGNVYEIRRIIYHPKYDDAKNKYDIAILQSHIPIKFNRKILPACLPNPDVIPINGKVCVLAGWGYTSAKGDTDRNILKQATQVVEDPDKCQNVYKGLHYNPNNNFCVKRSTTDIVDMQCRGDSGGPLVCLENRKWILYGVANWGPRDCEKKGEGGYSLVPSMMEWICCYITADILPCIYTKCNTQLT
ncbi:uncharacterized protein LOC120342178 [Styela clava]